MDYYILEDRGLHETLRKIDLIIGYGGILLGLFASGWFLKMAMMVDDPFVISVCVVFGCLLLIVMTVSCMLVMGVYERDRKGKRTR